jgi:hypothetical protein
MNDDECTPGFYAECTPGFYAEAQRTGALLRALETLVAYDFTRLFGSGIIITLTKLDGNDVTPPFCLRAEDLEKIKPAIIESLRESLRFRVALLTSELTSIEKAITP